MEQPDNQQFKVRFPISAKLGIFGVFLVLVAAGMIGLVSYLVARELQTMARSYNFEVNRLSASEVNNTLATTQTGSQILMQTIDAAGPGSGVAQQSAAFFFDKNQDIAALSFTMPGQSDQLLVNERFFAEQDLDTALVGRSLANHSDTLRRAALGETVLVNMAPDFAVPMLALFFPWHEGNLLKGGGAALFSPEGLHDVFGLGESYYSYLIDGDANILIHPDFELVRMGANVANREYIRSIRENPMAEMQLEYSDEGVSYYADFTKLAIGDAIVITVIEKDTVLEVPNQITQRNLLLTVVIFFILFIFIWFFSRGISSPVKALAVAANTIEGGLFQVQLKTRGHDEISLLTNSFQRMCAALDIFGRFTNKEVAVRAIQGQIQPGGLPKHATIFFSDIRGFTEKSENFTKEFGDEASDRIVTWLNNYFSQMVECVEKTGGVVDKFIGDAVMAHWGAVYTAGNPRVDAFNCVKAALMMRNALVKLNRGREQNYPGDPQIKIGCGINTGMVTAGQIGSDVRMEYTIIGDPVNLASRVESLNKPLGTDILITEDTWNLIKGSIIVEEMPSVNVKGKEDPVRVFAVINLAQNPSGPKTLADVRKLVGIIPPDMATVNVNEEEKKYKIGGSE